MAKLEIQEPTEGKYMRLFKSTSAPANAAASTKEIEILTARLGEIDKRRDQIETRLGQLVHLDLSFEAQELVAERRELNALRNVTDTQLRALQRVDEPSPEETAKLEQAVARREKYIQAAVAERREVRQAFIDRLKACGEFHQARIHQMALLNLRDEVERELAD